LEEVKAELLFTGMAHDEDGKGLVWTGETPPTVPPPAVSTRPPPTAEPTVVSSPAASCPTSLSPWCRHTTRQHRQRSSPQTRRRMSQSSSQN
jgi:hypothetical protein